MLEVVAERRSGSWPVEYRCHEHRGVFIGNSHGCQSLLLSVLLGRQTPESKVLYFNFFHQTRDDPACLADSCLK